MEAVRIMYDFSLDKASRNRGKNANKFVKSRARGLLMGQREYVLCRCMHAWMINGMNKNERMNKRMHV